MNKGSSKPLPLDLKPQQSIELLKELHILTREGSINQDSRRKLKQVYHLYQFIEPLLKEALTQFLHLNLVDHGAGKSYLGFILYDLFFKNLTSPYHIYGIEWRADLVKKSIELASRLAFKNMSFLEMNVNTALNSTSLPKEVHFVTALHACDTATDAAIDYALSCQAKYVVLIPCCQAEVAQQLSTQRSKRMGLASTEIFRHPLHTREFGSHLTNVLRCLRLESFGYQISVTEFVGLEHSLKNELILAKKIERYRPKSAAKLTQLLNDFGLDELKNRFSITPNDLMPT